MKLENKGKNLVITIPISEPRLSKTGRTLIVATTGGFVETSIEVDGKPVKVAVNAVIPK